jgi:hypothetical protein
VRLPICLFAVSVLVVAASPPAVAQKEKLPATQNELALAFADAPEKFKGKTLTLVGELTAKAGPLKERIAEDGIPFWVYPPNSRKSKLLLGVAIPKGFPPESIPNIRGGEEVVITFVCTEGKTDRGNKAIAFRRPE